MEKINIPVLVRSALGCLFIISGFEKIISPSQNFLYVVQAYDIANGIFDRPIVLIVPWVELLTGVFLLLGLWIAGALRVLFVLLSGFIIVVGQALVRRLPIDECGCFGGLFSVPLPFVLAMDATLLFLAGWVYHKIDRARRWSMDGHFQKNAKG